jgi:hypothetical protein
LIRKAIEKQKPQHKFRAEAFLSILLSIHCLTTSQSPY